MTETPAIIVGTNSYAGLAQADAIAAASLFNDRWNAADDDRRTRALMTATAMLDRLPWKGRPAKPDQPLAWPRVPFRTSLPQITADIVPAIVTATVELAMHLLTQTSMSPGPAVQQRMLGDSMTMYQPYQPDELPSNVRRILAPYLEVSSGHAAKVTF